MGSDSFHFRTSHEPQTASYWGQAVAPLVLRAPNIMKHTLRCHGFGNAVQAALSHPALGKLRAHSHGPKPCQPQGGCGQNRR